MKPKKIPVLLYIAVLVLACGIPTLPTPAAPMRVLPAPSVMPTVTVAAGVEMVVTGDLHIRLAPGDLSACAEPCYLHAGDTVICYEMRMIGDRFWCRHERGWSNARWLAVVE